MTQSSNKSSSINANGDGIAIGNNNTVNVSKTITNITGGGKGGGGKDNDDNGAFIGLSALLLIAIAYASFQYSRHADVIHTTVIATGVAEVLIGVLLIAVRTCYGDVNRHWAREISAVVSGFALLFLGMRAHNQLPAQLIELANSSPDMKNFWCQLTRHGRSTTLHGMLSAAALALAGLLTIGNVALSTAQCVLESDSRLLSTISKFSAMRWQLPVAGMLAIVAYWMQTPTEGHIQNIADAVSGLLCSRR
jgi:hypothetical protein